MATDLQPRGLAFTRRFGSVREQRLSFQWFRRVIGTSGAMREPGGDYGSVAMCPKVGWFLQRLAGRDDDGCSKRDSSNVTRSASVAGCPRCRRCRIEAGIKNVGSSDSKSLTCGPTYDAIDHRHDLAAIPMRLPQPGAARRARFIRLHRHPVRHARRGVFSPNSAPGAF